MAVTYVTSGVSSPDNGTAVSPSFNATAGGLIVVTVKLNEGGSAAITGVTDTAGNTYTALAQQTDGSFQVARAFYCLSSAAQAGNVITASLSGSFSQAQIAFAHYTTTTAGFTYDNGPAWFFGTTPYVTSSFSTTGAGVIYVGTHEYYAGSTTYTDNGSFVVRSQTSGASVSPVAVYDYITTSSQTGITAGVTGPDGRSCIFALSFIEATTPTATTGRGLLLGVG